MKMNATEITARREQIKTTRANIKTVVNIYRETIEQTPAETVAAIVERLGYDTAREAIAEIVNTVGEWDGRVSRSAREWAANVETAATPEDLEAKSIYQPSEIHPAHIDQLAQAMSKYTPPAPQEQEADQRKPLADMMSDYRTERDTKQIEAVTIVFSACTAEQLNAHLPAVLELAQDLKIDLQQEAVTVELDGTLYII
nr:MAG TPA: Protein of unknown function (DUF3849) [Caudoviricetes sp.]